MLKQEFRWLGAYLWAAYRRIWTLLALAATVYGVAALILPEVLRLPELPSPVWVALALILFVVGPYLAFRELKRAQEARPLVPTGLILEHSGALHTSRYGGTTETLLVRLKARDPDGVHMLSFWCDRTIHHVTAHIEARDHRGMTCNVIAQPVNYQPDPAAVLFPPIRLGKTETLVIEFSAAEPMRLLEVRREHLDEEDARRFKQRSEALRAENSAQ